MSNRNPEIETPQPYNVGTIHPDLRPRSPKATVEEAGSRVDLPRQTRQRQGRDDEGRPVYWCVSCDRRVASVNKPFCETRHASARRNFVRRRIEAWKKPLPVSWALVDELNDRADALSAASSRLRLAETDGERLAAAEELARASSQTLNVIRVYLPRKPLAPVGMPPSVADTRRGQNRRST